MRINSVTATATLHADTSTEVAGPADRPVASAPEHAHVGSNPFAVLGEALFRARVDFKHDQPHVAAAAPGSSELNPRQAAKRHGIIVIGGSQDRAAASTARDAIERGPTLQGIIIVGGSTPGKTLIGDQQPLPTANGPTAEDRMDNFEIQRLMSDFNQAETLASNTQKKSDDTLSGIAQRIG